MSDEVRNSCGGGSPLQTLRALMTLDGDETLSIAKTAINEGSKGLVVRALSVLQRWNEVRFGQALLDELEEMRNAGQIRDDFHQTDAGTATLREFFDMIGGRPDEERFRAFCALFMSANAPGADSNEAIVDLELMGILRDLTAGEMHVLSAFLKVRKFIAGHDPFPQIAKEVGYTSRALMNKNVQALAAHHLVDETSLANWAISPGHERELLTDLGYKLLERVERYNQFKDSVQVSRIPEADEC